MGIASKIFRWFAHLLLVVLLTVLTQVGGVIYLASLPFLAKIGREVPRRMVRQLMRTGVFLLVYAVFTFGIIPPLARLGGRIPLPLSGETLRPHNFLTCFLNRHYVRPALRDVAQTVAKQMAGAFPGSVTLYLDAGHPFWDGYPLIPHLSHNDGKKLDLAFFWNDARTGRPLCGTPSAIGYGVYADPHPDEEQRPDFCAQSGFWQYGALGKIVPQYRKKDFVLDEPRTAALTRFFCENPAIGKVFIEPHLKIRLDLTDQPKVRYHGCQAVRHDDHVHVQLR